MSNQWIAFIVMMVGLIFEFFGILGLIRLPDLYSRLQATVKCVALGSAIILLGVFIFFGLNPSGYKAILGIGIILVTTPVSAHAIARAAHRKIGLAKLLTTDDYVKDFPLKEE